MGILSSTTTARERRKQIGTGLRVVTHIGALLPLFWLIWDYTTGDLSADPIREMTLRTGKAALVLLVLTIAVTPLTLISGWKQLLPLRKPLGLYAFGYVCLHLLIYVWIDYGLAWGFLFEELVQRRYVIAGFTAFLVLLPLALTSTRGAMRRLGKNWKRLHRLVYVAALLAVIHYVWLVKQAYTQPAIFGMIVVLLLIMRLRPVRRFVVRRRQALVRER